MPLFSTIIPTYNRRDLLRQTLETVLSQDPAEPEIIVVDDGSTDGTLEMLAALAPRVQTLTQSHRGPGAARNLGLARATGEYVAFLDSDDLWFPWTLATYRRVIEQHNRPAFVTGCPLLFFEESTLSAAQDVPVQVEPFADYYASFDKWRWFSLSSFVVHRESLIRHHGFTNDAINGEDMDLAMKLGAEPGFVHITAPYTFGYRDHPGGLNRDPIYIHRGLILVIEQECAGQYPGGPSRRQQRRVILTRHARPGALRLLAGGRIAEAWEIYRRIWLWNLAELRFRYLLAFPLMILVALLRGKKPAAKQPA